MEQMRSLEDLLDLQVLDSKIDRLLDQRSSLPLLDEYRTTHEALQGVESAIAAAQERAKAAARALDKAEGELEIASEKLHREEQRLYAGGFGAREAEHLRNEVEMLRRQIAEREEETLVHMQEREDAETDLVPLEEEQRRLAAAKEDLEGKIKQEWSVIDADIARTEEKKASTIPLIEEELLELYEKLRPAKEGVAVARLAERVCGGCHLQLSLAEEAKVKKADPPRCLHCRRIVVPQ